MTTYDNLRQLLGLILGKLWVVIGSSQKNLAKEFRSKKSKVEIDPLEPEKNGKSHLCM